VIGPLLREIRPTGKVGTIAKWEGIAIDPIGATLAVLVFEAISSIRAAEYGSATINAVQGFASTAVVGLAVGLIAARFLVESFRRFWIPDYLQNPMTLLYVVATFAGAELLHHEAGLVAVTVMGVLLANQKHVDVHRIIEFKESLTDPSDCRVVHCSGGPSSFAGCSAVGLERRCIRRVVDRNRSPGFRLVVDNRQRVISTRTLLPCLVRTARNRCGGRLLRLRTADGRVRCGRRARPH
jgi:hypothetical protein